MPQTERTAYLRRFLVLTLVTVVTPWVWYLLLGIVEAIIHQAPVYMHDHPIVILVGFILFALPAAIVFSAVMAAHEPIPRLPFVVFLFVGSVFSCFLLFFEGAVWPVTNGETMEFTQYHFLPSQALGLFTGVLARYGMRRWDPEKPEEGGGE